MHSAVQLRTSDTSSSALDYTHSIREHVQRYAFDQEYLTRLERGEAEVENHFAKYFGELLLIKLRRRLKNPQLAVDLRQETFLRVFNAIRKRQAVLHPERLGSFVNAVCDNVLLEFYRSAKNTDQMDEQAQEVVDRALSIETSLISEERTEAVHKVLNELPQRDCMLLRRLFLEEREKDQLCRELNIDRNHLRVRVHRALARFRACLETAEDAPVTKANRRGA